MFTVHLPLLVTNHRPDMLLGVSADCLHPVQYPLLIGMKVASIRNVLWGASPTVLQEHATRIRTLSNLGISTWTTLFDAPDELRDYPNGPLKDTALDTWADWAAYVAGYLTSLGVNPGPLQVWNEADIGIEGVPTHYGGWGQAYMGRYGRLVRKLHERLPEYKLAVSFAGTGAWLQDFVREEKGTKVVFFHHYEGYNPTVEYSPSTRQLLARIADLREWLPDRELWLTETSLLARTLLVEQMEHFEDQKGLWLRDAVRAGYEQHLGAVIGYSYGNSWENCRVDKHIAVFNGHDPVN